MVHSRRHPNINRESGQASMVTVAMFMMLFAVVAVSFTYIVVTATRQATNETLQSTARAAAESGVEDAKRLLVFCFQHRNNETGDFSGLSDSERTMCESMIGNTLNEVNCDDILNHADGLGLDLRDAGEGSKRVAVGENDSSFYQCLRVATMSETYQGVVNVDGNSAVIPLKFVDRNGVPADADKVIVKWHRNSPAPNGDFAASGVSNGTGLPSKSQWNGSGNRPAIVRIETVAASKNGVSINDLVANDTAATFRPSTINTTEVSLRSLKPSDTQPNEGGTPLSAVKCNNGNSRDYSCQITLTDDLSNMSNTDYYMRINAIYKSAHFQISAVDKFGNPLYFDGVQPTVDVTGVSGDALSRIQAKLEPIYNTDSMQWWPEYAIETQGRVCKDINAYYEDGEDNCTY